LDRGDSSTEAAYRYHIWIYINIRDIVPENYRVVLSFAWFPLPKDLHVMITVGLNYGKIMGRERGA
jgi:hypothetical protein